MAKNEKRVHRLSRWVAAAGLVVALMAVTGVGAWVVASHPLSGVAAGPTIGHATSTTTPDVGQLDASTLPEGLLAGGRGGGGVVGDDYPYKHLAMDSQYDPWREYVRECTSFAAWALHSRNGYEMPFFANAADWGTKARQRGIRVDSAPARGAIAWQAATPRSKWGHVAWVAVVEGSRVTIEEYNYRGDGRYSTRTVDASTFQYIHFKDLPAHAEPLVPSPPPEPAPSEPTVTPPISDGPSGLAPQPASPPKSAEAGSAGDSSTSETTGVDARVDPPTAGRTPPAPTPPPVVPAPSPAPPRRTVLEQSGSHGSPTFRDPSNASGAGPRISAMSTVEVSCKVKPPTTIASAQPDGYWYRIHTAPWSDDYYAVANTFWNGDVPGQTPYTHNTDWSVPDC